MLLLEATEIKLEWTDVQSLHIHPDPPPYETEGIHVSSILRHCAIKTHQFTSEDQEDEMPVRVLIGIGWEWGCARLYPEMLWQPGAVRRNGIVGHPDGLSLLSGEFHVLVRSGLGRWVRTGKTVVLDGEAVVEEFKYTAKSHRVKGAKADQLKDIRDEWMWTQQTASYCNMHEMQPRFARFHVCWARGPYTHPMMECYMRYLIQYEPHELEGNWMMIENHRDEVRHAR